MTWFDPFVALAVGLGLWLGWRTGLIPSLPIVVGAAFGGAAAVAWGLLAARALAEAGLPASSDGVGRLVVLALVTAGVTVFLRGVVGAFLVPTLSGPDRVFGAAASACAVLLLCAAIADALARIPSPSVAALSRDSALGGLVVARAVPAMKSATRRAARWLLLRLEEPLAAPAPPRAASPTKGPVRRTPSRAKRPAVRSQAKT